VSFAAVRGTTIHRTSARLTATGTPPTTGTTTTGSGWGARFPPEPARSRSRRARNKRPGPSMMSTVGVRVEMGARYRGGAYLGSRVGDRRRRLFEFGVRPCTQSAPGERCCKASRAQFCVSEFVWDQKRGDLPTFFAVRESGAGPSLKTRPPTYASAYQKYSSHSVAIVPHPSRSASASTASADLGTGLQPSRPTWRLGPVAWLGYACLSMGWQRGLAAFATICKKTGVCAADLACSHVVGTWAPHPRTAQAAWWNQRSQNGCDSARQSASRSPHHF
jgi:hypothetical protein